MTARLPTTVMPVFSRPGSCLFGRSGNGPSPTRAPCPTTTSLSRIARSTTAPERMTESNMTIESRTTAPTPDAHARRQHGVHDRAVDDAAVADQAAMDLGGRPDLGRRPFLGSGVDDPVLVVEVELGVVGEERHVGLPVRLDRADVLPVAVVAVAEHAGAGVDHRRDDVAPEVDVRSSVSQRRRAFFENT